MTAADSRFRHLIERDDSTGAWRWSVVIRVLGLILLAAAALKGYELIRLPQFTHDGWLDQRPLLVGVVMFEAIFGWWLLIGPRARWTWWAALGTFTLFLLASLHKAISGADSCGCFGPVRVNPWYTAAFDAAALAAIAAN